MRKGSTFLNNGGSISGATSATLIINPAILSDASANYNVIVYGLAVAPADTSKNASLIVNDCGPVGIASFQPNSENETAYFFPNPFTTNVVVKLINATEDNTSELRIYNSVGVLVLNKVLSDKITIIDTNFPAGIYFYKVFGKNKAIQSGRLVAQ